MHTANEQQEDFGIEQQAFQDLERDFQDVFINFFKFFIKYIIYHRYLMNYQVIQALRDFV